MEAYEKSRLINKRSGLSGDEYDIELEPGVQHKPARGSGGIRRNKKALALFLLIGVAFLLLLMIIIVSVAISHRRGKSNSAPTAQEEICASPPVLLVSLDGLWSGYLNRSFTPFLDSLAAKGVRAEYMRSEFPTETFPNHFSIVTGLHPESHGIVNNKFYDSGFEANFTIKDTKKGPATQRESRWWLAEPIWVTAIEHGQKSNVYFWPGSEVEKILPTVHFPYNATVPFDKRIDTILGWLDAPSDERPRFMAAYFNEPDHAAHKSGPDSDAVNTALSRVDDTMKSLFDGLKERGVEDCVNLIIVSDHGMTAYNSSKLVTLNNLLPSEVVMMNGVQSDVIVPKEDKENIINQTYFSLVAEGTEDGLPFRVYHTRDLPLRLHTGHFNKQRYGDLYLIGDEGAFLSRTGSGVTEGLHGYDNILTDMQASFIAHGPAFKKGYVSKPFANIELYNLMCALLRITPSPNNGTMGSLYHLLTPSLIPSLPPPQTLHVQELEAARGVSESCPFPTDQETYDRRSFCDECVCWDECAENITNATISEANQMLNLTADKIKEYQNLHLPWGVPSGGEGSSSCLLTQQDYVTLYSNALHIPLWTAFKLTNKQAAAWEQGVDSCLRRDPRIPPASSSNCTDYTAEDKNEDLIAVSLAAAALSTQSTQTQRLNANLLSSVVPQMKTFNTSVWTPLTELLRSWASSRTIHVFLGSVLDTNRDGRRDNDANYTWWLGDEVGGVAIPTHFYAVVVRCLDSNSGVEPADCNPDRLDTLGLLFQHPTELGDPSPVSKLLRFSLTPVRDIERVTGIDFFPSLSLQQQNILELRITNQLWSTENM